MRAVRSAVLFLIMAVSGVPAGALEAERGFRAEYRVSYFGLKVASSSFTSRFSGDTFLLKGSIRSAGIARLFDSTTAETRVSGRIEGDRVEPLEYVLNYTYGGRQKMTAIRFADGKAVETENRPQVKRRGKKWVPLGPEDLSAVFDPITATIIRARSPAEVCNRTIRAYDGEIRVDLKLSYAGTLPFATEGFKGEAVRCRADFEPVAGYRRGREALEYLRRESRIELAFAPVGANDIYALVTARVDTEVGPVHLRATRFAAAD